MMSLKSKRELLEVVQPGYLKANKAEKQKILENIQQPLAIIGNTPSEC